MNIVSKVIDLFIYKSLENVVNAKLYSAWLRHIAVHKGPISKSVDDRYESEAALRISNWEKYTIIAAAGWGLSGPERAGYKLIPGPETLDCSTVTVEAPPVNTEANGFYSLTIYGKDMFLMTDENNTVKSESPDSMEVTVGPSECAEGASQYLEATRPWNIILRAYEPDSANFMAQPDGKVTAK